MFSLFGRKLYILENSKNNKLIKKDILNMEKCWHRNKFLILDLKNPKNSEVLMIFKLTLIEYDKTKLLSYAIIFAHIVIYYQILS